MTCELTAFGRAILGTGLTPEAAKAPNMAPESLSRARVQITREPGLYAAKCRNSAARRVKALERLVASTAPRGARGDRAEANIPMSRRSTSLDAEIVRAEQHRQATQDLRNAQARLAYWAEKAAS